MKVWCQSLGIAVLCLALLGVLSCARDQQLVAVSVTPLTPKILGRWIRLSMSSFVLWDATYIRR